MRHSSLTSALTGWACAALAWAFSSTAAAVSLPDQAALQAQLQRAPQWVKVVEPHLSTREKKTQVEYRGYPAELVLDALLGQAWRKAGVEVEFRALDGYVSRIPSERFARYRAWLVQERRGQTDFSVDNLAQNEKKVPLGPYYLVWDNIRAPSLVAEGGTFWPYQVAQVLVSTARSDALLPPGMAPRFKEQAALTQKYCLSCHQINGYGGEKSPADLARRARELGERDFMAWVLTPSSVKPGTTMPALADAMPDARRKAMATKIHAYLMALPLR